MRCNVTHFYVTFSFALPGRSCEGSAQGMRLAGVTLPLFSVRTARDWGIGQITDLGAAARWLRSGGFGLLQILPPYELSGGETSPYGARTAFGIDPIFLGLEAVPDLDEAAIAVALGQGGLAERERLRASRRVDHRRVRATKERALDAAFERFLAREWSHDTGRARELRAFISREAAWEDDLALYVALRAEHDGYGWETWPTPERDREPAALAGARARLGQRVLRHQYAQWLAHDQWACAKREIESLGMLLMGDLPFVVCTESADVWTYPGLFQLGKSLGAPPDEFDPELGQDWGLPPYDWPAIEETGYAWMRARTRRAADLYHAFRVDHVIGCFRQYVRLPKQLGVFDPPGEKDAEANGRKVLSAIALAARPATVIAEDLGVIPAWARAVLASLELPGYKVLPWEKDEEAGLPRDPKKFPPLSVATWSTHDTPPLGAWWEQFTVEEQAAFATAAGFEPDAPAEERTAALMRYLYSAASDLVLVQASEVLGTADRINTPGTVGEGNWTYRLPRTLETLAADPDAVRAMLAFASLARSSGRAG